MSENQATNKLAIHGGEPTVPAGPPLWPNTNSAVRDSILSALDGPDWGSYHGGFTERLAAQLKLDFASEHVHLVSSGTIAVELALRGLGIGPGDEVILAAYDFPGNFRAIEMIGARPVLVDVIANGWTIDLDQLENARSPKTKAVIASHLHSQLISMQTLLDWSKSYEVSVVEDACQCPGAMLEQRPVGSFGDVGVLSFGGSKLLTAGRGGAVLTNDDTVAQRIKIYCERGNDAFPLSQLQAAALVPQLIQLKESNNLRLSKYRRLLSRISDAAGLATMTLNEQGAYYKSPWMVSPEITPPTETLANAFRAEGLALDQGFRGFSSRSAKRCRKIGDLNNARIASDKTLLLHHPVLLESDATIDQVGDAIKRVMAYFMINRV